MRVRTCSCSYACVCVRVLVCVVVHAAKQCNEHQKHDNKPPPKQHTNHTTHRPNTSPPYLPPTQYLASHLPVSTYYLLPNLNNKTLRRGETSVGIRGSQKKASETSEAPEVGVVDFVGVWFWLSDPIQQPSCINWHPFYIYAISLSNYLSNNYCDIRIL